MCRRERSRWRGAAQRGGEVGAEMLSYTRQGLCCRLKSQHPVPSHEVDFQLQLFTESLQVREVYEAQGSRALHAPPHSLQRGAGENSSQHFLEAHLCPTAELVHLILSIPGGGYYDFPDEQIEPLRGCLTQGHPAASGEVRTELRQLGQEPVSSWVPYRTSRQQGL